MRGCVSKEGYNKAGPVYRPNSFRPIVTEMPKRGTPSIRYFHSATVLIGAAKYLYNIYNIERGEFSNFETYAHLGKFAELRNNLATIRHSLRRYQIANQSICKPRKRHSEFPMSRKMPFSEKWIHRYPCTILVLYKSLYTRIFPYSAPEKAILKWRDL